MLHIAVGTGFGFGIYVHGVHSIDTNDICSGSEPFSAFRLFGFSAVTFHEILPGLFNEFRVLYVDFYDQCRIGALRHVFVAYNYLALNELWYQEKQEQGEERYDLFHN